MEKLTEALEKKEVHEVNDELALKLKNLGLTRASDRITSAQKMTIAYGKYLFVTEEKINDFNSKLRKDTIREMPNAYEYKRLLFVPLEEYNEVPPPHVLEALEKALEDKCFDTFEIAKVEWIKEIKDPIVFGRINNCTDRFFISQWDDDVKFEDILFLEK